MAVPGRADSFFIPAGCSSSWRRHGYANDACLPAASHCIGFSLKRLACVSDPLPLPGHHYPQPRPITRPLNKGDYYSQQDMLHDTESSLHISTHYTLWPVYHIYETKQNKTKEVLVIVRVCCWLLAMAAFCACSSDRLLGEGRRDRGRHRSI